jgi:hypothetical protein
MAVAKSSVSQREEHECPNDANKFGKIGLIRPFAAFAFQKVRLSIDFATAMSGGEMPPSAIPTV